MPEPQAVVEALNDTINAHDVEAGARLYAAGARLVAASGREMDLAGLNQMLSASFAALPDLQVRVLRWVIDGDTAVTEELMTGTSSGRAVSLPLVHITRVADGHIVERVAYHDTAAILRQMTAADPA
ncbi:MAG: SnoaL-like polyketide cyclase [Actinomycetota bacterium]|jgi:predicted ester cyclase|nr:SnoaL-like polyketide cyclase [Actinomycetota bacterium]